MCKYLQATAISAMCLVLANPGQAARQPLASTARLPIPSVKLPAPNGYGLLMQAGKSLKELPEGSPFRADKLSPPEQLKLQRAYSAKNARALSLMKQALQLPTVLPPVRGYELRFPEFARLRQLARLGWVQSRVFYADGQQDRAVQSALDVVQMSALTQNGANIIGLLVSVAIQGIGRQDLWKWYAECDTATSLRAARRLQTIEASTPSYAAIMQEEEWSSLSQLQETLASPEWKRFRHGDSKAMASLFKNPRDIARLRRFSDLGIQRNLVRAMDRLIAQSRRPYSHSLPPVAHAADPLSEMSTLDPQLQRSIRAHYERERATNRLLATAFALQAFKRERGQFPRSLAELSPKYLQAVPLDPFAPDSALRYRRKGSSFTLYSIGPDGVDNGGKPIEGRGIGVGSRGDMVVGFFR